MMAFELVPFLAAAASILLGVTRLLRRKRSPAAWTFGAGMTLLGIDSLLTGFSLQSRSPELTLALLTLSFMVKSLTPGVWLLFSLTYSRGDYRQFLARWKPALALAFMLPVAAVLMRHHLFRLFPPGETEGIWQLQFGLAARALNVVVLLAQVLILTNLEQTFRAAVGTMRWRIKFVVLAMAVIFGARLYVRAQAILFSASDIQLWGVESGALLIGCTFLVLAYARTGLTEIDVYPSLTVVRSSLTVLVVGAYLFVVGVVAQLVRRFGGAGIFQFQAFIVLLGLSGLAVLLLSDRARQRAHLLVLRHFRKAQHDSARIWTLFSRRLATVKNPADLCDVSAKFISEMFDVLSVTVWLLDEDTSRFVLGTSTSGETIQAVGSEALTTGLRDRSEPFDLETRSEPWANELRQLNATIFPNGGNRFCVPLRTGDECLGVLVLADRVNGAAYTSEELELLKCIGDQMTAVLLGLRLSGEVARARELEAFRTMSAFFVHDLKNAAASLNLMLKNLPVHFDDPEFRADALRGIGNTAQRIDQIIARLTALRSRPELTRSQADLNEVVTEALDKVNGQAGVVITKDLHPLPAVFVDRDQIQSVVTNLVLNARDAVGAEGRILISTEHVDDRVVLSVADNGCGMSEGFVKSALFRPFQSTKKKGLGIGLFQSRSIVQAHGGGMHVESAPGKGTTFQVSLPARGGR